MKSRSSGRGGSLGTPAPRGSMGPGPVAGAGEMPRKGPGRAAMRTRPDSSMMTTRAAPSPPGGISTYKKGNPPPKGYRQ